MKGKYPMNVHLMAMEEAQREKEARRWRNEDLGFFLFLVTAICAWVAVFWLGGIALGWW